jgi:hypothetical protein
MNCNYETDEQEIFTVRVERDILLAVLQRIEHECGLPASNGVTLTPEAMLVSLRRYARAAIAKVQS